MNKFKINIPLLTLLIACLAGSCNFDNPAGVSKSKTIDTQSKWILSINNTPLNLVEFSQYDKSGNVIRYELYDDAGILQSKTNISYTGNMKFEEVRMFTNGTLKDSLKNIYRFNDIGKVTERISTKLNGDTLTIQKYDYDNKGNLELTTNLDKFGAVISKINYQYQYNRDGYVIGTTVNPGNNGTYLSKDTIIYNLNLHEVGKTTFNANGIVQNTTTYIYNEQGIVIKEFLTDNNGNILKKYQYIYSFF